MHIIENNALSFLLSPDLNGKEGHRINYVAISRAKDNLYISTPTLSSANQAALRAMGIHVEILP